MLLSWKPNITSQLFTSAVDRREISGVNDKHRGKLQHQKADRFARVVFSKTILRMTLRPFCTLEVKGADFKGGGCDKQTLALSRQTKLLAL